MQGGPGDEWGWGGRFAARNQHSRPATPNYSCRLLLVLLLLLLLLLLLQPLVLVLVPVQAVVLVLVPVNLINPEP